MEEEENKPKITTKNRRQIGKKEETKKRMKN